MVVALTSGVVHLSSSATPFRPFCLPSLLIVFFAGGSYFDLFPLRGLVSANFDSLPWYQKITDYLWHITLPVLATVIGGFAALTMPDKKLIP